MDGPDGLRSRVAGRPWSDAEDDSLRQGVAKYGVIEQWKIIAAEFVPGRTNKACRKRWLHSLSPTVKKSPWTPEEDNALLTLHFTHGPRWALIARSIPGRTDDACSKRYREALDPSLRKEEWTEQEDRLLLRLQEENSGHWVKIGQQMARSSLGCRNRWRLLNRRGIVSQTTLVPTEPPELVPSVNSAADSWNMEVQDFTVDIQYQAQQSQQVHPLHFPSHDSTHYSCPVLYDVAAPLPIATFSYASSSLTHALGIPEMPDSMQSPISVIPPNADSLLEVTPNGNADDEYVEIQSSNDPVGHDLMPEMMDQSSSTESPSPTDSTLSEANFELSTQSSLTVPPLAPVLEDSNGKRHGKDPRLSARRVVIEDPSILPYACGHISCWPVDALISTSCFPTSKELSDHDKEWHSTDSGDKSYRCALPRCGKSWKSINGLQYHLQVSKVHFANAISKAYSQDRSSSTENQVTSVEGSDKAKKMHACPRPDCNKIYRQASGLRYHLAHSHPQNPPAQLDCIPPPLAARLQLESNVT